MSAQRFPGVDLDSIAKRDHDRAQHEIQRRTKRTRAVWQYRTPGATGAVATPAEIGADSTVRRAAAADMAADRAARAHRTAVRAAVARREAGQ